MPSLSTLVSWTSVLILGWCVLTIAHLVYNILLHPLRGYPGPLPARWTTWYKTYIELVRQKNWTDNLVELHARYGRYTSVRESKRTKPFSPSPVQHCLDL